MLKKEKGITLIALIITIVVLLILAGITITGSIQGVDKANDNKLMTDLQQVHHAITERETKYKLTKDNSLLVGTKIDITSLTDVPSEIKWKVVQFDDVDNPEREYYRIGGTELMQLGLTSDPTTKISYIVNYYTGEVYNETDKKTSENKVLYVTSEANEVSKMGDEIIKDGLLVWYDGENNTGNGHSSTTTVWKDLSGNGNDATLYGFDGTDESGWHSNYLAFDGQNDYVTGALNTNGDITVEFIANKKDNNNATMFMFNNWRADVSKPTLQLWTNGIRKFYRMLVPKNSTSSYQEKGAAEFKYISNSTYPMCVYTITKGNNTVKTFNNGQNLSNYTESSFIERFNITDVNFTIGKWHSANGYYSNQDVYAMRVYNRALSEDEIHHNYLIDKAKYGITEE